MLSDKCGVYLIVSPSGGRYVGSSRRLGKRFNRYKNYSCAKQSALHSSLKKYGFDAHKIKILMYCEESERFFWERVFGDLYLSLADFPKGLNIVLPGYEDVPEVRTQEFRDRVSLQMKKRFSDPEQRRITGERTKLGFTEEVRKTMSQIHKAKFDDPKARVERSNRQKEYYKKEGSRQKASEATKKFLRDNPEIAKKNYSVLEKYYEENPHKRGAYLKELVKNDPDYGRKISERNKQYYIDNPEARARASEKTKIQLSDREANVRSKKVINIDTNEVFSCANAVAELLNVPSNTFLNSAPPPLVSSFTVLGHSANPTLLAPLTIVFDTLDINLENFTSMGHFPPSSNNPRDKRPRSYAFSTGAL